MQCERRTQFQSFFRDGQRHIVEDTVANGAITYAVRNIGAGYSVNVAANRIFQIFVNFHDLQRQGVGRKVVETAVEYNNGVLGRNGI